MGKNLEGTAGFDVFEKADKTLELPLSRYMFEGPEDELTSTAHTQPAIVNHSIAHFINLQKILERKKIKIDAVLGHSVGEYAALVAAGSLTLEQATKAVHLRGRFMQEAVPAGQGKMIALLNVPADVVEKACQESSSEEGKVMPANFNEPNQIVISGEAKACDKAVAWLEKNHDGAFRHVELNVSAPFHSNLMNPAAKKLAAELDKLDFRPNQIPYYANIDAHLYPAQTDPTQIIQNLVAQVAGSVQWTQSFQQLPDETICLEVGPGRVLMGLARKINRNIKVLSLDKEGSYEELEELFS
jgi:[acyl-carrier-protein] S-malonyltransferase